MTPAERISKARAVSTHCTRPILFNRQYPVSDIDTNIESKNIGINLEELKDRLISEGVIDPTINTINSALSMPYVTPNGTRSGFSSLINSFQPNYRSYSGTSSIFGNFFKPKKDGSLRKQLIKDDILEYLFGLR